MCDVYRCESCYCKVGLSFLQCNSPTIWFIICSYMESDDHATVHRSMPSDFLLASLSNATWQFSVFLVVVSSVPSFTP